MSSITLAQASTIVDVALKTGRDRNMKPLVVIVLDAGGHLVAYKREDKTGILRFEISYAKAYASLGMGFGSRGLFERAQKNALFVTALESVAPGTGMTWPGATDSSAVTNSAFFCARSNRPREPKPMPSEA